MFNIFRNNTEMKGLVSGRRIESELIQVRENGSSKVEDLMFPCNMTFTP